MSLSVSLSDVNDGLRSQTCNLSLMLSSLLSLYSSIALLFQCSALGDVNVLMHMLVECNSARIHVMLTS